MKKADIEQIKISRHKIWKERLMLEQVILSTPTGRERSLLTEANIALMLVLDKLNEATLEE